MKQKKKRLLDPALAAPMASAPMKYDDDGSVAWGDMWDSYCVLALEGGPPHREVMLESAENEGTTLVVQIPLEIR